VTQRNRKLWISFALSLALVFLAVWGLKIAVRHAAARLAPPGRPLTLLWTRRVNGFHGAALSPQGELVALSSGAKGTVSLWHWRTQPDHPLWTHPATNASSVAVGATGASVLAWAALDPNQPDITILRGADGAMLAHQSLGGAVWDAEISADGAYAGIVTGGKTLYLYTLSDQPYVSGDKRIQHWPLGGIGNSVAFPTLGSFLVTGTWNDSSVACYTPRGTCLWQYPDGAAARHALSSRLFTAQICGSGRYVLAYARLNPLAPRLTLLRGRDGQRAFETVDGAIWALALASDGGTASFVTGNRSLYQITLGETPTVKRALLSSQGNSVAYALGGTALVTGTWDTPGVECQTVSGRMLWHFPQTTNDRNAVNGKLFDVKTSQDGKYALGMAYRNASHNAVTVYFWRVDGDGEPLWTLELGDDVSNPAALINADGSRVALAYDRQLPRRDQTVKQRRLRLLDRQGHPYWGGEKGGMIFAPHLIALAPDGQGLVISDGSQTLYRLNAQGRNTARIRLNALIRQTIPSADGRFLLVYTGDGLLTLLQVD